MRGPWECGSELLEALEDGMAIRMVSYFEKYN